MGATFNPEDPKWKTCCCHVVSVIKVVSWISIVCITFGLILCIILMIYATIKWGIGGFLITLFLIVILLIILGLVICPLIGIKKSNPWLIIPFIFCHACNLAILPLGIILKATFQRQQFHIEAYIMDLFSIYVPQTITNIWLLYVSIRCYQYIREVRKSKNEMNYELRTL